MVNEFSIPVRVYYEDTDAAGVVYYANYLKFMERARTEWLRAYGFDQEKLTREAGVLFAVRSVKADYLKPAWLDDELTVSTVMVRRGSASITFEQQVRRGSELLCPGEVRIACLAAEDFAPTAIPAAVNAALDEIK